MFYSWTKMLSSGLERDSLFHSLLPFFFIIHIVFSFLCFYAYGHLYFTLFFLDSWFFFLNFLNFPNICILKFILINYLTITYFAYVKVRCYTLFYSAALPHNSRGIFGNTRQLCLNRNRSNRLLAIFVLLHPCQLLSFSRSNYL